ncbi:MAG: PD-(D/E)XK nuclease family protein, partial [Pseudomonadota bacterium]|nr:PD-(D/E)XK nuclease family protein [Pseudomonadota bacterium]
TSDVGPLRWSTQVTLRSGKRPDLVLYAGDRTPILVVESKIYSDASARQLKEYGSWLHQNRRQSAWPGALAFLTHMTEPPTGFADGSGTEFFVRWQRTCRWHEVGKALGKALRSPPDRGNTHWKDFADEFIRFLLEARMIVGAVTNADLAAAENFVESGDRFAGFFERLRDALHPLWPGAKWQRVRKPAEYKSGGALVRDWLTLPEPQTRALSVEWGIRFSQATDWWKDVDVPLPEGTQVYVSFGPEKLADLVTISRDTHKIPTHWSIISSENALVAARAVSDFSADPDERDRAIVPWIEDRSRELRDVILPRLSTTWIDPG